MAAATTVVVGKPIAVLPLVLLMFSVKLVGASAVSILIAVALTKLAAAIRFAAKPGPITPGAAWQPPES